MLVIRTELEASLFSDLPGGIASVSSVVAGAVCAPAAAIGAETLAAVLAALACVATGAFSVVSTASGAFIRVGGASLGPIALVICVSKETTANCICNHIRLNE